MKVDVVVIGGGPGGYVSAIRLAQYGKKVLLVEKYKLGGECLNYGCIPSKALIFASSLFEKIQEGENFGLEVSKAKMNMKKLQKFRVDLIDKLNKGIGQLLKVNKIEVLYGEASFQSPMKILLKSKKGTEVIEAAHTVIATGSRPIQISGFEFDSHLVIGSKEALELSEIPKRLIIIGGGVIGLELGTYFSKLGSKVSIVEMMPQLLPGIDKDLVFFVEKNLRKKGVEIYTQAKAKQLKKSKTISLTIEHEGKEKILKGDRLLITIGRRANIDGLNLEKIGVKVNEKGFISVNDNLESTVSNIYAIGDVVGQPLLAHKASHDGLDVADAIALGAHRVERPMSWAIFTDPEIAGVGLTTEKAKEEGPVMVGKFPFVALGRALAVSESEGFTKIVADKKTEAIKGVFIVGAHASDLISEGALAVTHGLKLHDIANTIHPHPTLSEALMEAAEAAKGEAIHIGNRV